MLHCIQHQVWDEESTLIHSTFITGPPSTTGVLFFFNNLSTRLTLDSLALTSYISFHENQRYLFHLLRDTLKIDLSFPKRGEEVCSSSKSKFYHRGSSLISAAKLSASFSGAEWGCKWTFKVRAGLQPFKWLKFGMLKRNSHLQISVLFKQNQNRTMQSLNLAFLKKACSSYL